MAKKLQTLNCCSWRGPEFKSQHPQGDSQLSVAQVLGELLVSYELHRHQAQMPILKNKQILEKESQSV